MWIDSHCHVTADRFDGDRQAVLSRAGEADLVQLIAIGSGYGLQHNTLAADLARDTEGVFASAGLHPHDANLFDADTEGALRTWLARDEVVAVGECGLDYHYMNSEREDQRRAFAAQVALARELDLPVSIHVRDDGPTAYDELLAIWCEVGGGQTRGVLHCYTGTLAFAKRALEHDFFVSFSGILTFKRSTERRVCLRLSQTMKIQTPVDRDLPAPQFLRCTLVKTGSDLRFRNILVRNFAIGCSANYLSRSGLFLSRSRRSFPDHTITMARQDVVMLRDFSPEFYILST